MSDCNDEFTTNDERDSQKLCEDFNWAVRQSSAAQNLKPNAPFVF